MDADAGGAEERYREVLVHAALRSVVHDLNNPLGTITMAAGALRSAGSDTQRAELIDLIEREAMRAGATARVAAERTGPPPSGRTTSLSEAIDEARAICDSSGVDVAWAHPPGGSLRVAADTSLLARTLAAFVLDAHRSPSRRASVRVSWQRAADLVEVAIHDDGDPVPPERAGRPFGPFPGEGEPDGRAVGLAVAAGRYLVRSLGGTLELHPGETAGNTVRLSLPLATPQDAATDDDTDADADADALHRTATRRALVVDDDQTMRNMLEVVLRRDGWSTTAAADGSTATAAVSVEPVDLVLLDLHVGHEHGPDIAARLEAHQPGVGERVVYLSGDVPSSGRIGGRPAIAKPFVLEELYEVADAVASGDGPL